jgi:RNA polymerase sigma factor (sigma-70 family)
MSTSTADTGRHTMATDLDLLKRYAADGDTRAFAQVATRHRDMVFATCYRVLGNDADAEDAAQDCFVALARSAGRVSASVGGWLHRVATRTAKTLKERQRALRDREHAAAELALASDDGGLWEEVTPHIDQAIDRLPDQLRVPLVLYYLDGCDQATIARDLGVSQAAVSRRVSKGVERVRDLLRKSGVVAGAAALTAFLRTETSHAAPVSLSTEPGELAVSGIGDSGTTAAGTSAGWASLRRHLGTWQVRLGAVAGVALVAGLAVYSYTTHRRSPAGPVVAARTFAPQSGGSSAPRGGRARPDGASATAAIPPARLRERMKSMEPTFVERPAFAVMGVLNSDDPTTMDYGDIWGNQFGSRAMEIGPVATERNTYGVYFATEQEGVVDMVAGMPVLIGTEAPEGLVVREVPAATYAVFPCTMAEIRETWQAIENDWLPSSDYEWDLSAACFELFPPEATGAPDSPLTIYVAVKPKADE